MDNVHHFKKHWPGFFHLKKNTTISNRQQKLFLQIFRCLQNCQIYESKILLLYVRAWFNSHNMKCLEKH